MTRSLKRSAGLLLLAGMASLALLTLVRGSVGAQSVGETASITAQGNELWSATLRVSNHRGLMGYSTYSQRTFGDLTSDTFSWQGTTFTVNNVLYDPSGGNSDAWDVVADFSPMLLRIDADGEQHEHSLAEAFFTPSLVTEHGISGFLRGLAGQVAQEVDAKLVDQIRNLLFGASGGPGRDLASLNIQRGRDHGVPSYNDVRGAYGLAPVTTFADISSDPVVQEELRQAYGDVDLIDLWPGGLAEDHVPGAIVGKTFRTIIADQFRRLRDGDRFWYENDSYFLANPDLLKQVRGTTLADIIRRNTEIGDELPDVVFGGLTPVVSILAVEARIDEDMGASFVLTRTGTISRALTLELEIAETGAVLAGDQVELQQATFGVGEQTITLTLFTDDDADAEFDGAVEASIVGAAGFEADAGASIASVTVLDNDSVEVRLEAGLNRIEWPGLDGLTVIDALGGAGGQADVSDRVNGIFAWNELS